MWIVRGESGCNLFVAINYINYHITLRIKKTMTNCNFFYSNFRILIFHITILIYIAKSFGVFEIYISFGIAWIDENRMLVK